MYPKDHVATLKYCIANGVDYIASFLFVARELVACFLVDFFIVESSFDEIVLG